MSYSSALGLNHNDRQTQSVYTNYTQIMMHFHVFTKCTGCCCQRSISNYTTIQKLGVGKIFLNVLEKSNLYSPSPYLFDKTYSDNSNIVKYYSDLKLQVSNVI